jgi:beta-lactamase regulating signal transducer with metallopeptidase domain
MASGINSTFRQIGIATGVAALGSILASQADSTVVSHLANTPLAGQAHALAASVSNGSVLQAIATVPAHLRGVAAGAAKAGFVDGINVVLLIGAVVSFVAAVLTFVLIRQRDFVGLQAQRSEAESGSETLAAAA